MIFGTYKQQNETVLRYLSQLYVNSCSPEGATKMSTFSALYSSFVYTVLLILYRKN